MKYIISFFFFIHACTILGQTEDQILYAPDDLESGNGEKYDDFLGYQEVDGAYILRFKQGKKINEVNCKDIWGLMRFDRLFRIYKKKWPVALGVSRKTGLCLWVYGISYLREDGWIPEDTLFKGPEVYFSQKTDGNIVAVSNTTGTENYEYIKFFKNHPEYKWVSDCIGNDVKNYDRVNECFYTWRPEKEK